MSFKSEHSFAFKDEVIVKKKKEILKARGENDKGNSLLPGVGLSVVSSSNFEMRAPDAALGSPDPGSD